MESEQDQRLIPFVSSPYVQSELVCQIDGSWSEKDNISGYGWVVVAGKNLIHLGLRSSRRSLSPHHAEMDSLIWALRCLSKLLISRIIVKTDCKDLIAITDYPEDWPSFASERDDFSNLKLHCSSLSIS